MTFRERLQQDHPGLNEKYVNMIVEKDCPCEYYYEENSICEGDCNKCWNREMPRTEDEETAMLKEVAEKAAAYDAPMKSGEWVNRGGGLESREKDGRIEFRYVGPTVSNEEPAAGDPVNAPSHYNAGGYECWDVMEAVFGPEAVYHFCMLNAWKYMWRAGKKDDLLQDLRKATKNLEKAIEVKEKQKDDAIS